MPNVTPPPVPTQSKVLDSNGLVTRPWLAWLTTLGQQFGYNQTVTSDGTAVPQEVTLDFSSDFVLTDDPKAGVTTVSLKPSAYSIQRGQETVQSTGGDYATLGVMFATEFADVPQVFTNPTNGPRGANAPMSCYATNVTTTGFTINLACSVPTGGGGATIDQAIPVDWLAIG